MGRENNVGGEGSKEMTWKANQKGDSLFNK